MSGHPELYPELARKLRLAGSSTFSHVGALHRTRSFDDHLLACLPAGSEVGYFRLDNEQLLSWVAAAGRGYLGVIHPDGIGSPADRVEERLSNLHKPIEDARFRGASFLFVSQRPLTCYPGMVGSSVLVEAEKVNVKALSDDVARAYLEHTGVPEGGISKLLTFAAGSRALIDIFADVEQAPVSGNEKRRMAERMEGALAHRVYAELGPDIATLVDSWVFEAQLEEIEDDDLPSDTIRSALSGSGIIRREERGSTHNLLPFKNRAVWVSALGDWISSVIDPPESWTKVAAELFALERDIRQELATRYATDHGEKWKSAALGAVAGEVLELARRDAIPAAHTLEDLRSPLDWLQLTQLLARAEELAGASGFLGLRATEWQRLAREVLPVRHRIAHMRLVRTGDLDTVRKSRRFMQVRRGVQQENTCPV